MDKKDFAIIKLLKENSKLSTKEISKRTKIPMTTIHNRIKKLEEEGIIKGYSCVLDYKKIGRGLAAYILITVDYRLLKALSLTQHELAKKLKQNENVEEVAMITGSNDIIIKVRVPNIDVLDSFVTKELRNIEGVEKTETMVILNEL